MTQSTPKKLQSALKTCVISLVLVRLTDSLTIHCISLPQLQMRMAPLMRTRRVQHRTRTRNLDLGPLARKPEPLRTLSPQAILCAEAITRCLQGGRLDMWALGNERRPRLDDLDHVPDSEEALLRANPRLGCPVRRRFGLSCKCDIGLGASADLH